MAPDATKRGRSPADARRPTVPRVDEWIVDGNNVMGARPDGWWRDRRAAQRRLVDRLETFADARDAPVTVIFDGRPHDAGGGVRVAVRFARRSGRDAADDDVAALVARHPEPENLIVVTSDGELANRVRAHGARVIGAGAFLDQLDG
jgi:predicted RNA-binding protein with PIN domain